MRYHCATSALCCYVDDTTLRFKQKPPEVRGFHLVGDTGIEPVTSSVSGKRATAAPIAHFWGATNGCVAKLECYEVATGFEPVWTALQAAASPLGHATIVGSPPVLPKLACSVSLERMTRFELATLTLAR